MGLTPARRLRHNGGVPDSDDDADLPDLLHGGPSLDADGRLVRPATPPAPEVPAAPTPYEPEAEPVLELDVRPPTPAPPPVETFRQVEPRPRQRYAVRLALLAAALGAVLLAGALVTARPQPPGSTQVVRETTLLDTLLAGGPKAPAIITSTPPGATITIDGAAVGVTPWAGDNAWPAGTVVRLEMPGFSPWEGRLEGSETRLDARLKRQ